MYPYQARDRRKLAKRSKNKFPKSYMGRPKHRRAVFHPRMLSSYQFYYHTVPCGLNPTISLSLGRQEVTLPLTTDYRTKGMVGTPPHGMTAMDTVDLQILF